MKSKIRVSLVAALFVVLTAGLAAHAQSTAPLSLGTWTTPVSATCPDYYYPSTCYSTAISCPNTTTITATYGYKLPTGTVHGTIVYFTGGAGTDSGGEDRQYAYDYFTAGYTIVQMEWSAPWENTNSGPTGGTNAFNIQTAACRASTFMKMIYANSTIHPSGNAFCAQGASAGSAELGYALAWYGAGGTNTNYAHLDNAELIDGPMFSDLKQGCIENSGNDAPDVAVCPSGTSQKGCSGWGSGDRDLL